MSEKGPGHTHYPVADNGSISCQRWNDPAWRTQFLSAHDLKWPDNISRALRRAYEAGYADRGEVVRRAISEYGDKP